MRLTHLLDPIAERVARIATVSPTQWVLRGAGAAATIGALLVAHPDGPWTTAPAALSLVVVGIVLLIQLWDPESDIGPVAPGAIIVSLAVRGGPTLGAALATAALLLIAHAAFAIAATLPAHGRLSRSGWALVGRGLVPVLALSVVIVGLVLALAGATLGPWMIVVGMIVLVGLFVGLIPREGQAEPR